MTAQPAHPRFPSILAASATASVGLHVLILAGLSQVQAFPEPPRSAASRLDALAWSAPIPLTPPIPLPEPQPEPQPEPEPEPEPEPQPEPEPVPDEPVPTPLPQERLGIEQSDQDTKNWLGVADPTEHRAPLFDTEQPSWSPEPGIPLPPGNAPNAGLPAPPSLAVSPAPTPSSNPQTIPIDAADRAPKGDANVEPSELPTEPPAEPPTPTTPQDATAPLGDEARDATTTPSEGPMPLPAAASTTQGTPQAAPDSAGDALESTRLAPSEAQDATPTTTPENTDPSLDVAAPASPQVDDTSDLPIADEALLARQGDADVTIEQDGRVETNEPLDDAQPVQFSSLVMAPLSEQAALLAPLPFTPPMAMRVSDAVREALRVATQRGVSDGTDAQAPQAPAQTPQPTAASIIAGGRVGAPVPPGARPAEVSESDSSPTSRIPAIDVKLGRPAAGQGLEVITVRPRFSVTTQLTADPQRSSINVVFGRDGTVLRASFADGKTTGYPDVDGPLLDAVYRWRAKGKALLDLPEGRDPAKGLLVTFNIEL